MKLLTEMRKVVNDRVKERHLDNIFEPIRRM